MAQRVKYDRRKLARAAFVVVCLLLLAYGIMQPLLLRSMHLNNGENLKVADVISVLATVLAILAAAIGLLTYSVIETKVVQTVGDRIAASERDAKVPLYLSIAFALWVQLEPLLLNPLSHDLEEETARVRIIDYAVRNCRG
jgi:hypothetical protein